MNKFFKRLALLLAVLMIVSMMPVQLFADNSVIVEGQSNGTGENGTGEASGNSNAVAKIGDTGYESLADAIANATPDANGVITYEISGKAEISGADQWISFVKNAEGVTAVKFVGMTADAEISITSSGSILGVQGVDVDVSFENLTLSHPNGAWVDDLGHATKYFTCMVRNSGHTVTYTNCTFPNGACNNMYGNTVFNGCKFTNATSGKYNLWNYGGNTEIKNSTFTGVRGVKTYNEGTLAVAPTVKIENTTFDGLTEKAAIVTSKATDITLDKVSATDCGKGFFQKAIEGSSDAQEIVVVPVGSNISGKFNVNGTIGVASAEEFNISGGTFTSEVSSDYLADGFELKKNSDGTYGVKAVSVAKIGTVEYASLDDAIKAAKDGDTVTLTADINTPETSYYIQKSLTIDLGGKTLTGSGYDGVFNIEGENAAVLIKNGKIVAVEQTGTAGKYTMAVWACAAGCAVTLEDLDVSQQITHTDDKQMDMIYTSKGTIIINSGRFESGTPAWTLNCNDSAYKAGTAKIIVNGGTFVGYDPRNNKAEGEGTSFVAPGVGVDAADGSFTAKAGMTAQVMDAKGASVKTFATLAEAIAAAKRNNTVKLLADTKENVTISTRGVTLDLNGFTLNGSTGERKPALTITERYVTIKDSSEAQTGTIMREDTAENSGVSSHYVIDIQGNAFVTFESGNVKNDSGAGGTKGASLVRIGTDDQPTWKPQLTIKGGTFTQDNFIVLKVGGYGTLYVNGGTINSKNSYAVENWSFAVIKDQAVVNGKVSSWTYKNSLKKNELEISGGTINGNVESVSYDGAEGKLAKVKITGGTVNGTLSTKRYSEEAAPSKDVATIEVTGGTFKNDPSKYVVEDSAITKNADGTFGVAKAYLAKVGDTSYYTMDEAFKAQTASGKPIVLLRDYTTGSTFNSGTVARVVDLNGHTWTCTGTDANSAAFEINNPNASLTVKNGKIVSSQLVGLIPSAMGGTIKYDNSSLMFENVQMSTTATSGIETNGNNTNDTVKLVNSTLNVPNGFGIYFPSSGKLIIENSKITAKTMGVQVCSGALSITGADTEITVTGDAVPKTENDGAIQDGAAISIVNRTGYKGLDTVTVSGGKFTAKKGNSAIKAYDWVNNTESDFTADKGTVAVSGGTFSSAVPADLCAEGFIPTKNADGTYGVKTGKYVAQIGDVKYATLADAFVAAKDGDTIKLLDNVDLTETLIIKDKTITLDLNGKTISNSTDIWNESTYSWSLISVRDNGDLTIDDTVGGGTLKAKENDCFTLDVYAYDTKNVENTKLTVNAGNYIGNISAVYAFTGKVTINGGHFSIQQKESGSDPYRLTLNCYDSSYTAGRAGFTVNGGTFENFDPRNNLAEGAGTSFVAEGVGINKDENGNFTAVPNMAAQIVDADGNSVAAYAGHYDAIAAAKDGEKVILLSDRKNFVTNTINANITIDLNGKTLSLGNNNPFFRTNGEVTIQNGTIDSNVACVIVNAYNKLTLKNVKITGVTGNNGKNLVNVCSNAEVTIDKDTVLTASGSNGAAVFIGQDADADAKYTLNVYGKVIQESKSFAISGNGSYKGTTTINIYDGAEVKSASVAIYHPQAGVINVNGGLVEGYCAIGIKSGLLNIKGGTVRGTANDNVLNDSHSTSGTIKYDGSAIVVDSRSTGYAGNVNINVTGGTVESYYSTAIREIGEQDKPNMTQLTKLNVTGGSVLGASKNPVNVTSDMLVRDISVINISVSGGTFKHAIPEEYCADGFIPTQNDDGTYGVKEGKYVAQIGDVKYETLEEAFAAAKNGDTITLLSNVEMTETIKVTDGKKITLALNGFDITITATDKFIRVCNAELTITGNGTIKEQNPYFAPIIIKGGAEGSENYSVVNIKEGVTLEGWAGVMIDQTSGTKNNYGMVLNVEGATLNGVNDTSGYSGSGIYVNGVVEDAKITLTNTTVTGTGAGMYLAGNADTTINGGSVKGDATGIEIRAGKLTLNNCDVTGGNGEVTAVKNGNGTTVTNAALAISQHTTKKPIDVTIDGGTFNGTAAVYQTDVQGTGSANVKIAVKSGTFNGTISGETDGTIAISGGKFKVKVDDKYFDGNHACSTDTTDGYYTVAGHPITKVGLTLGEDISIRIGVDAKYKDGMIKVTYETYDSTTNGMVTEEIILDRYELAGTNKYQFRISNITPQMADVVFTLQYLDSEGNEIGSAKQISIVEYCRKFAETSNFEAYRAKIGQLLNYCATAMDFRAVSHADYLYNGLSWAERATALRAKISEYGYTVADIDFKTVGKYINRTSETIITGFGIEFAESVKLYYFIALDDYKDGYTYVADGLMTPVPVYEDGQLIGYRVYLTVAMDGYHTMRTLYVYEANGNEVQRIGMAPDYALKYLYNSDKQTNEFKQLCKAAYQYFIAFAE